MYKLVIIAGDGKVVISTYDDLSEVKAAFQSAKGQYSVGGFSSLALVIKGELVDTSHWSDEEPSFHVIF